MEQSPELRVTADRSTFIQMKAAGEPIVMLTCYDYPTAVLEDAAGIDIIFVGDSVGTNVLGYESETEVTMDDMLHHLRAVRRGVKQAYLLVDMPNHSYDTPEQALRNARAFIDVGADGVKLEGGVEQVEVVRALAAEGIDVCGHIGYTPQTLHKARFQGKTFQRARELVESAEALQEAGIMMLVLELVTEGVAETITRRLRVPTIGIGSGRFCDGQVLVITDVLGLTPEARKITKRYLELREVAGDAIRRYADDVRSRTFPTEDNAFPTSTETMEQLVAISNQ